MIRTSIKIFFLFISFSALIFSCNNNKSAAGNAVLDTVSVRNKNFELAYQDGSKIVVSSMDTMKQISFGGATNPALSPDGKKLAYTVSDTDGNRSIWIADLENKSQVKLNVNSNNYYGPVWSPDGNAIAFNIFYQENRWKAGLIKADNTGFIVLDSTSVHNAYAPTWKNNQEIVWHDLNTLYTFNKSGKFIDSLPVTEITGNLSLSSSNRFFYSKDGEKILFSAMNDEIMEGSADPMEAIYSYDIHSKRTNRISPENMNVPDFFVTADDRILYSGAKKPYTQSGIYVSDFAGNSKLIINRGTNPTGSSK